MRQIILDTETTGLIAKKGHRIIEIGCVEMVNRRLTGEHFHTYLQPGRAVDEGAIAVHGITDKFLKDKPRFEDIVEEFKLFIQDTELIIHNAPFDVGFIEHEFTLLKDKKWRKLSKHCGITDTLVIARKKHPGQRNNLDALCKRYGVDNQHREKHGALLDAEILADVYLAMTGGQNTLSFEQKTQVTSKEKTIEVIEQIRAPQRQVLVIKARQEELTQHEAFMKMLIENQ